MDKNFSIVGNLRSDGFMRFSSDDLPGFRLLLKASDDPSDYDESLTEALRAFVPLYFAAEARSKKIGIRYREGARQGPASRDISAIASFAA